MKRSKDNFGFGCLLSLILPGAGHIYFREYLFGIFVFLIMLGFAAVFFAAFLVTLPETIRVILFGLPLLFYLFSFVDLWKSRQRKSDKPPRSGRVALIFLFVSVGACLAIPVSPANFLLRNRLDVASVSESTVAPLIENGDLVWINRMAYRVNLFFLDRPLDHDIPERGAIIQFRHPGDDDQLGIVIGLGGEEITAVNDTLFVDGFPVQDPSGRWAALTGELTLTLVDYEAILVATLNDGVLGQSYQVPGRQIIGEVHRLF